MKTKKELLQKLHELNVNPFLKARAKRLSVKNLQNLIALLEFIEAVRQVRGNNMSRKEYMSIKQSNKKITENFQSEFVGYYNGKKL